MRDADGKAIKMRPAQICTIGSLCAVGGLLCMKEICNPWPSYDPGWGSAKKNNLARTSILPGPLESLRNPWMGKCPQEPSLSALGNTLSPESTHELFALKGLHYSYLSHLKTNKKRPKQTNLIVHRNTARFPAWLPLCFH